MTFTYFTHFPLCKNCHVKSKISKKKTLVTDALRGEGLWALLTMTVYRVFFTPSHAFKAKSYTLLGYTFSPLSKA